MANKNVFKSSSSHFGSGADTVNEAGGIAYSLEAEHALAQLATTGTIHDTFYEDAKTQLHKVLELSKRVSPKYLAQLAVYARQVGYMKDMPAVLVAILASRNPYLLKKVFPVVIDNGKMLRTFVQVIRSGVTGRKSMGTAIKRLVQNWLEMRTPEQLFRDSVGNDPSLADIIKMAHPRPSSAERQALYGYLIGKKLNIEEVQALPKLVQDFETFKLHRNQSVSPGFKAAFMRLIYGKEADMSVPPVPFQMLTSLNLTTKDWKEIALQGGWHFVRMNLNTFARHGVLQDPDVVAKLAETLSDEKTVKHSKVFPYQLFTAYQNVGPEIPMNLKLALQDAMEHATANVPAFTGEGVIVCVDVSGSMRDAVTGNRGSATSKARCIDVAGLMSSIVLRQNPNAHVVVFSDEIHSVDLNPRDSVMTNAEKLASINGGGTYCSLALQHANAKNLKAKLVIYVSDNQSWIDTKGRTDIWGNSSTATVAAWDIFKKNNPGAKMVNININPYTTTQASNASDIMNVGGFSDTVFDVISRFVSGGEESVQQWVDTIKSIKI
ncbi:putative ribonucleoprotein related-protein [Myxococcus phage Mx1]|nr:putative ribonucleoprotein related-protein [Myxococcus phage Mx1]